MRLILSCIHDVKSVTNKDHLLLLLNTETEKINWLPVEISDFKDIVGTKGIAYSGDFLVVSVITNSKKDKILIINVVDQQCKIANCIRSSDIHSINSVFRGRFYVSSTGTNSMNQVVLSPATNNIIRDVHHYKFDQDIHFNSLINWDRRWYASFFGEGWRDGNFENGAIIELSSNNRKIYSNINQPNSLFFNRNDELCFCESGKGLFHFGQNIVYLGGYPRGVIEDRENNGYWIALSAERENVPLMSARLVFLNYDGLVDNEIVISNTYDIYNIVEAEGFITKLF